MPTNLINNITTYSHNHSLFHKNDTLVVGLSGGPDSVFLLHYLLHLQKEYSLTIIAAHLNHEWRPEADKEEQFCRNLAEQHDIPFISSRMSNLTSQNNYEGSKEAFARNMRRAFLQSVHHAYNATSIALGHHAQDQQETFFIRLLRGTSLTGLTSMQPKSGLYIRPLLETSKQEIVQYLHDHALSYMVDESNESPAFLRNRIRMSVIPALKACDERFDVNFSTTLTRLQQTEDFLDCVTKQSYETLLVTQDGNEWVSVTQLLHFHPALQRRILLHWLCKAGVSFAISELFLQEIIRFLQSPKGGTHTMNAAWHIVKKRKHARIISHL